MFLSYLWMKYDDIQQKHSEIVCLRLFHIHQKITLNLPSRKFDLLLVGLDSSLLSITKFSDAPGAWNRKGRRSAGLPNFQTR